MKTIALRFGEHFSPDCGTISAHQKIITKKDLYGMEKWEVVYRIKYEKK